MLSRRNFVSETKLRGCTFSAKSIDLLERYVRTQGLEAQYKDVVNQLCSKLKETGCSGMIDPEQLQRAIDILSSMATEREHIFVISAYETPKFVYDFTRRTFVKSTTPASILGSAKDKIEVFKDRYDLLLQRALRYDLFVKSNFDMKQARSKLQISTVSSIDGAASNQVLTILGMLYMKDDGSYVIEDLEKHVTADLTNAKYTPGLFVDGCFVLAQGTFSDGVFHVSGVGFPPSEPRQTSLKAISQNVDFFGHLDKKGNMEEEKRNDALLVVLADVFLNDPKTLVKLRGLFGALVDAVDVSLIHFILVGSFIDVPFVYGDSSSLASFSQSERTRYAHGFDRLADVILEFPTIASKSKFVIVPGPNDPTLGGFMLPQPPIPQILTANLRNKVTNVTLTTNPCRIRVFSQEIVIFRDDAYRKHRRHCLPALPPLMEKETFTHLVKTVVDQAHLSCMPLTVTPIFWANDNALRLFPLPDTLFLCDTGESSWETEYMECGFLNPGGFSKNGTFLFYRPGRRQHEFQKMQ